MTNGSIIGFLCKCNRSRVWAARYDSVVSYRRIESYREKSFYIDGGRQLQSALDLLMLDEGVVENVNGQQAVPYLFRHKH